MPSFASEQPPPHLQHPAAQKVGGRIVPQRVVVADQLVLRPKVHDPPAAGSQERRWARRPVITALPPAGAAGIAAARGVMQAQPCDTTPHPSAHLDSCLASCAALKVVTYARLFTRSNRHTTNPHNSNLDSCPSSMRGPAKLQRAKPAPTSALGSVLRQAGLLARTCEDCRHGVGGFA